ncbi:SP_1767 family glycosyltransferase [Bacillus sp. ISL-35]|uniref:SP_1767 family glycosyltransferase n=1 Tax=Bacillus sp. ISL-35 TaxID=2819122 RepID=UPI001BEA4C80|nr:SP_1767 family glycosyltransferase [Bacillus sp. ISL-35]MBT2679816.1 SP_1767 family glycosyltransferase [Bacillus sp. ISL-35]MBT2704851.1 SP_1767 family glycosyltransferase [Chryseobacterium sp. ISL-80]
MKSIILKFYNDIFKVYESIIIMRNKFISLTVKPPTVRTTDETLTKLIEEKASISRFGDGEFALMNGKDLLFQPYIPLLARRLKEIIKNDQEKHLVGIPNVFLNLDWCSDKASAYWNRYLNINRFKIYRMINFNNVYYDSLVTRLYIDHKDKKLAKKRFNKYKQLWNNRSIVIVEGDKSRLGIGNDLFNGATSIERIICPSTNAFEKYEDILNEVIKHDRLKLILIALGPTATVLAYDLAILGYHAIDIGHIDIEYEWFLQGAEEKVPVKSKYIGEIPNGTNVQDIEDQRYKKEIIVEVV